MKALTIYGYHDGPTIFTAQDHDGMIFLFRWVYDDSQKITDQRKFKADGPIDVTILENDIDWSEAQS